MAVAGKIVTVPVNPGFTSLNLAQAVILIAYEWSKHEALAVPTLGEPAEPRASHEQLEGLIGQLDEALVAADYFHPPGPDSGDPQHDPDHPHQGGLVEPRGSGDAWDHPGPGRAEAAPRLAVLAYSAPPRSASKRPSS